jgi:N-acyl-D-amino-acid deacylase
MDVTRSCVALAIAAAVGSLPPSLAHVASFGAQAVIEARQAVTFDVILRGGTVIDGTGAGRFNADVAIVNGWIARVGNLEDAKAAVEVDVTSLYVAPGFINIHSHPTLEGLRAAENMLTQGVTTEILNPDGGGPLDLAEQLARLRDGGLAVNAGANIGFNSIWASVVGPADRRPAPDEIEKMRALVVEGLRAGAWGLSAGLDYKPAYFASTEEVIRIAGAATPWRTVFTNHDRITPESGFSSRAGIQETIAIGEKTGLVPVVTHMKAQGVEQGTAPALLKMMRETTERGHYTAGDVYPYLAGQSGLGALIIPGWAQDGGREAMLKRFRDPALRAKIVAEAEQAMSARFGGPQGVFATGSRQELTDAMREMAVGAGEALVRLLEKGDGGAILRFGAEKDLIAILKDPAVSIACDCGAVTGNASHPRYYGSFPRVLGVYTREGRHLTWEEAVRKMTGLPATTIGMVDRGFIQPGMAADISVFDPKTVLDHATFEYPTLASVGIRHVLVNGRFALRDGRPTGERAGQTLARTPYEPSRPMNLRQARRVQALGTVEGMTVALDVRQNAGDRTARGTFIVRNALRRVIVEMKDPAIIQVGDQWASVTGRAMVEGQELSLTVVVDRANPLQRGTDPSISLRIEGREPTSGRLIGEVTITTASRRI